ncbi:Nuclear pore complex protein [Halotydeus destructor]|nr:Nuclear pore complex protein [Halotydeus destructor]
MSRLNNMSSASSAWMSGNLSMSRNLDFSTQSMNQSNLQTDCKHRIEQFGSMLPVLVVEAISTESVGLGALSARITEHGWAWLICGRKLFVWRFKDDSKRMNTPCFELELPPSDLVHKADLVTLLLSSESGKDKTVGVIAVSPAGCLRYWPNIAYESHSIETTVADLYGEECMLLASISSTMCILGTTTSSLVCINIKSSDSLSPINFRTLKAPQGMLAGFSKKVTSFIFGGIQVQSHESRQLMRIQKAPAGEDGTAYVLAGTQFQKWILQTNSEKLVYEYDVHITLRNSILERTPSNAVLNQFQVWAVDFSVSEINNISILVAYLNPEVSRQLNFAVAKFEELDFSEEDNIGSGLRLNAFSFLSNFSSEYSGSPEETLGHFKLLNGRLEHRHLLYIYNSAKVLCVKNFKDIVDQIDLGHDDGVLGAGVCDNTPLLFTYRDALISLSPNPEILSESSLGDGQASSAIVEEAMDDQDDVAVRASDADVAETLQTGSADAQTDGVALGNESLREAAEAGPTELRWLGHIERNEFEEAAKVLLNLATKETVNTSRKKTLLSLSKLSCLAVGEAEAASAIDDNLDNIMYEEVQETSR